MKQITSLVVAILAGTLAAAPSMAGQTKNSDDKSFGDWSLHCAKNSLGEEACALHQKIMSRETRLPVAAFSLARNNTSHDLRLAAILPLGLDVPAGVSGKAGDVPLAFQVQTCVRRGCVSTTQVDDRLLETLHRGQGFTVTFKMRGVSDPTTVSISANGLDEGLKALESR